MEIIGLDLHERESQLSIKADDGTITLARRLAGILYAMWRDDVANDAHRIRPLPPAAYQRAG